VFIVHMIVIKRTPGRGGRIIVFDVFVITKGPKTTSNRFYGHGSDECFYVNGVEAPTIKLQKGLFYEFKNETDEPLYFTTDSNGGGDGKSVAKWHSHEKESDGESKKKRGKKRRDEDIKGFANGTIFFEITKDLPGAFYYHSARVKNMGSAVIIS